MSINNQSIEWKRIKRQEKAWFPKLNDPCVSQFSFLLVSLFHLDRCEFVSSYFNDCPFWLAIFGTILLFRLALIDMVNVSINLLVLLRCAQISVLEGENLLVMKVTYILNDIADRACGSCLQVSNWILSTNYI